MATDETKGQVVKVYQHQFTGAELDFLIETLKNDLDASGDEMCQTTLENLEQTKTDGPIFEMGSDEMGG
jgi:hypothetical protein